MLSRIKSATTLGIEAVLIDVEVDVANRGFPSFTIVGLATKAVDEAKDRVRTAIVNTTFSMPESRITVNLAPADIPKTGSHYDLPIALGILVSSGVVRDDTIQNCLFVGELSLEGTLREVPGIISILHLARLKGFTTVYLPSKNSGEAALISGITVIPVTDLGQLVLHLNAVAPIQPIIHVLSNATQTPYVSDFKDIYGQAYAKRALLIAASGFHNVHLTGSPGAGKTLLCRAIPSILPPLTEDERFEVARIYSSIGLFDLSKVDLRPYRAPHHTTSKVGLIGGGSSPSPGEITLAHNGVLFLDEIPEFPRSVLESLRQPLEDGVVAIARAEYQTEYPCRFILLAASNPCPCGYLGHPKRPCTCTSFAVTNYKKRLSGPLMDRIDLQVAVSPVDVDDLDKQFTEVSSAEIQQKVIMAQNIQSERFKTERISHNHHMSAMHIKKYCKLSDTAKSLLKQGSLQFSLSARSYFKVIKVSQTIADLAESPIILDIHIAEALQYRMCEQL